jgi:cell division protein FtsX
MAIVRLLITAASVGIGVAFLFSVLAIYHGYDTTRSRPCWTCTGPDSGAAAPLATEPADNSELWNVSTDFYNGTIIERADVASLGTHAPVMPGLTRVPQAGEFFASPALARLLTTVPHDQLADRFPGALAGLIGPPGLAGPDDLAVVVGRTPTDLAGIPGTTRITQIRTSPQPRGDTVIYRFGFGLGAVAVLLPMVILIGNATRLAAARREERHAAMRLVGATPRHVAIIASTDALLGAGLGAMLGLGLSRVLHPLVASITITGSRFFPEYVQPTITDDVTVLIGVPLIAAATALITLRRVQISPLGVSRRVTPPPPRIWRVIPLAAGLALFMIPLLAGDRQNPHVDLAMLGLALIMIGLIIGGSWLTMQTARVLARLRLGPASLLAARRIADDPRTTFRSVSGLVLAVFVGTWLAGAVPAAIAADQTPTASALKPVLRLTLEGQLEHAPDALLGHLRAFAGATPLPIYSPPEEETNLVRGLPPGLIPCAPLTSFPSLGHCGTGVSAVRADAFALNTDSLAYLDQQLPLVTPDSQPYTGDLEALPVRMVLITVDSPATLERLRTYLAVNYPDLTSSPQQAPQTFAEVAAVRSALYREIGHVVLLVVVVTLLVAGSSLAIAMGGGVIERKRPFTLLRVSGAPTGVLRRVVMTEALLPLAAATVVAAALGLVTAIPINRILNPTTSTLNLPDHTYYLTMAAGLVGAIAVIALTLPLLNRATTPNSVRFE